MDNKKINVVIVISNIDKSVGFEWLVERIDRKRFALSFVLLNSGPSHLATYLRKSGTPVDELSYRSKKDLPGLLIRIVKILRATKADVVHTHLFDANIVGQLAARILRIPKRIYTRHSSNENRRYYKKQRYDHIVNSLATHIIAISENVRNILVDEEGVSLNKIRLIHHGFDLDRFQVVPAHETADLRTKYNPNNKYPVIGVIARYSHWKGIQVVIPAFQKLLLRFPDALLILANARRGDYATEIGELLSQLPAESFREIEFENNIFALYPMFDLYVHTPIDAQLEAFGQTYVEALAAGVPSVFTLSGVAPEFLVHERNALVVDFENSDAIFHALVRLLDEPDLREKLSLAGKADVRPMFTIEKMIGRLEELYAE